MQLSRPDGERRFLGQLFWLGISEENAKLDDAFAGVGSFCVANQSGLEPLTDHRFTP